MHKSAPILYRQHPYGLWCAQNADGEEEEVSVACFGTEGDVAAADGASIKISNVKIGDKLHGNDEVTLSSLCSCVASTASQRKPSSSQT